ncbi:MAG: helix-turn-helix domain-containing protein [Acidimicrobiales bacterium]
MPRITGPTIAAHVAQQEAAVVRAATELFAERGFAAVTMADIAERVGLARSSLYRYFPDKDHILLAWLRRENAVLVERSRAIAESDAEPQDRLRRWLRLQLDYLQEPDHQLFAAIASSFGDLEPEVLEAVVEEHRRLYATVEPIVADALQVSAGGRSRRDPSLIAQLVVGLLRAASEALGRGVPVGRVRRELERAAVAVVEARPG